MEKYDKLVDAFGKSPVEYDKPSISLRALAPVSQIPKEHRISDIDMEPLLAELTAYIEDPHRDPSDNDKKARTNLLEQILHKVLRTLHWLPGPSKDRKKWMEHIEGFKVHEAPDRQIKAELTNNSKIDLNVSLHRGSPAVTVIVVKATFNTKYPKLVMLKKASITLTLSDHLHNVEHPHIASFQPAKWSPPGKSAGVLTITKSKVEPNTLIIEYENSSDKPHDGDKFAVAFVVEEGHKEFQINAEAEATLGTYYGGVFPDSHKGEPWSVEGEYKSPFKVSPIVKIDTTEDGLLKYAGYTEEAPKKDLPKKALLHLH